MIIRESFVDKSTSAPISLLLMSVFLLPYYLWIYTNSSSGRYRMMNHLSLSNIGVCMQRYFMKVINKEDLLTPPQFPFQIVLTGIPDLNQNVLSYYHCLPSTFDCVSRRYWILEFSGGETHIAGDERHKTCLRSHLLLDWTRDRDPPLRLGIISRLTHRLWCDRFRREDCDGYRGGRVCVTTRDFRSSRLFDFR